MGLQQTGKPLWLQVEKMHWIQKILKIFFFAGIFSKMMAELSSKRKMSRLSYQSANSSGIMNQQHHAHPKLDRQRNLTLRSRSSRVEPLGRSSLRSKGSSNSSEDKVKMFKNCVRKMIEFLFLFINHSHALWRSKALVWWLVASFAWWTEKSWVLRRRHRFLGRLANINRLI